MPGTRKVEQSVTEVPQPAGLSQRLLLTVQRRQQHLSLSHQQQQTGNLIKIQYHADNIIKQADVVPLLQTSIQ